MVARVTGSPPGVLEVDESGGAYLWREDRFIWAGPTNR